MKVASAPAEFAAAADAVGLAGKLRFLQSQGAYPGLQSPPKCVETHMSWVFLAADRAYKLKKPVRFAFLDFSTLQSRERDCREELRLNQRLAPGVYLGLVALQTGDDGSLTLVPEERLPGAGTTVDWLVLMRRLPRELTLQSLIANARVEPHAIDALISVLVAFYRSVCRADVTPEEYLARLRRESATNRQVLLRPEWQLRNAAVALDRFDGALATSSALLVERAARGCIVDGHGDLRPEHVWLLDPPVVIDCLEFNAALREVDPFDELAFLALECEVAGAGWIGPRLLSGCSAALSDAPDPALIRLYVAYRALLRARLTIAHLLDPRPVTAQLWPARAARYVDCAMRALAGSCGEAA